MPAKKLLWLLPLTLLAACGHSGNGGYDGSPSAVANEYAKTDSTAVSAADAPINSPERKIIHTADFHCKVRDVFTAATKLEQMVKNVGGVVQESRMENSGYDTRTSYYTSDSLRQTQTYTTTATLTLRIPSAQLDSVVNAIPGLTCFIDSRMLKQSDVTYNYLSNALKNQVGESQASSNKQGGKKGPVSADMQVYQNEKQEQKIDRSIQNRQLLDDVNYATLTIALSQPEQVFVQTIVNTDQVIRTPFISQCKAALAGGWNMLRALVVGLINIWPVLILLFVTWVLYRKFARRKLVLARQ